MPNHQSYREDRDERAGRDFGWRTKAGIRQRDPKPLQLKDPFVHITSAEPPVSNNCSLDREIQVQEDFGEGD